VVEAALEVVALEVMLEMAEMVVIQLVPVAQVVVELVD